MEIGDMPTNPILEEIYAAREKLLADAGGDVQRYPAGVRERERSSGRLLTSKVVPLESRVEILKLTAD